MNRLEKCGTVRGITGVLLILAGFAVQFWLLSVAGLGLILWALSDVHSLEAGGKNAS